MPTGDHALCRAVLAIFARELERYYQSHARARGWTGGRSGSVTAIQRAGSALNLDIHFHTLALDGVFREEDDGALRFHSAGAPSDADVARVLERIRDRVVRLLVRKGIVGPEAADDDPPALGPIYAASVEQKLATGERAGLRPQRGRSAATVPTSRGSRRGARLDGFDLHASAAVRGGRRRRLERLARYVLRPPVAQNRLEENDDRILLHLLRPWRDGSTRRVTAATATATAWIRSWVKRAISVSPRASRR